MGQAITPRRRDFPFAEAGFGRHWLGNYALGTHIANALNLLFPMGERFFVRSVRHYMSEIEKDPALLERVRNFSAQEGHHAHAHVRFLEILREQGYDIDRFLALYKKIS